MSLNIVINLLPVPIEKLSPTEDTIYKFLERYNKKHFLLSQKELAIKCNASEAAVSRLCRKLNFQSYKNLVIWFNQELTNTSEDYHLFQEGIKKKSVLANLITSHKFVFEKNINYELIKKCNQLAIELLNKNRVIVFGLGTSHRLSYELSTNISRLGINAVTPQDIHSLLPLMGEPNKDEIYIFISTNLSNKEMHFLISKVLEKSNVYIITTNSVSATNTGIDSKYIISYSKIHNKKNRVALSSKTGANLIIDMIFTFLYENISASDRGKFEKGMRLIDEWNNLR